MSITLLFILTTLSVFNLLLFYDYYKRNKHKTAMLFCLLAGVCLGTILGSLKISEFIIEFNYWYYNSF